MRIQNLAVAVMVVAAALLACGPGGPTGGCSVDCSSYFTGKIDVRNYTYLTKEQCTQKAKETDCSTQWCDYACDTPCCVNVY